MVGDLFCCFVGLLLLLLKSSGLDVFLLLELFLIGGTSVGNDFEWRVEFCVCFSAS